MEKIYLEKLIQKRDEITRATLMWASDVAEKEIGVKNLGDFFVAHPDLSLPDHLSIGHDDLNVSIHAECFNGVVHCHDFFELIMPMQGQLVDTVEGKKITLGVGDLCIHNPKSKHAVSCYSDGEDVALNVLISKKLFKKTLYSTLSSSQTFNRFFNGYEENATPFLLFKNTSLAVRNVIGLLVKHAFDDQTPQVVTESLILVLFSELFSDFSVENKHTRKEKIYNYIINNLTTCKLETTARAFGYHPKYFCALVKKEFGITFQNLLNRSRVQNAAHLLEYTDMSVEKIAEAVGYNDAVSLYTNFKKYFKKTPLQYKKEI